MFNAETMNNYLEQMQELEIKYNESKSYLDRRTIMQQIKALESIILNKETSYLMSTAANKKRLIESIKKDE